MRNLAPTALAALLALTLPTVARASPFETALNAFNAADYATAFSIWWPLARDGDPKSEASLGFMYYSGKGVQRDDQRALFWFRRAADAGQPTAQFYLGMEYFYGRGVPRDLAQAYSWCDIALTNGYSESLSCRDTVARQMSPDDRRRAAQLTVEFFRTHEFRN
jgi:hypothetical protein